MSPYRVIRRASSVAAVLLATVVGTVVLGGSPAAADPSGDKARVDRQLAQTRAALEASSDRVEQAAEAFDQANRLLPQVRLRLVQAQGVLAGATAKAQAATVAANQATADLAVADASLGAAFAKVAAAREAIGRYAADAYKGRYVVGVDLMLSVTNPADFVAGLTYLRHVAVGEQEMLDTLTTARAEAKNQQNVQVGRALAAEATRQLAAAAVIAATTATTDAAAAEQEQLALIQQRQRALVVAGQERAGTEARYRELQAESDRIAAQIRGLARGGGPTVRVGIRLPMPVVGWKSSDFGMRFDPFYRVWRLHAGVDLAAPGGAPIWAAAAGRVFRAGWNGGYGNYTCIYHGTYQGKGFATCYAHQSAILVRVGQQVSAGQLIGRVGTTGASTGNHLHFEVRLNGVPVNPIAWLPSCLC